MARPFATGCAASMPWISGALRMRTFLLGFLLALAVCAAAHAQPAVVAEHLLGPGDVIRVSVYQNPDLTLETRLSEQGQISFPLIGNVPLGGASLGAAQDRIG